MLRLRGEGFSLEGEEVALKGEHIAPRPPEAKGEQQTNRIPRLAVTSLDDMASRHGTGRNTGGELQTLQRSELYRQANAVGRSAQGLELFEKRIIVLALSCIDHRAENPSLEAIVPLRAFEEHGIDNPYDRAKRAAEVLPSRVVIIPRDDGGFDAFPWLQRLSYVPVENSDLGFSYVRVVFNEELRPWITNLRSHYAVLPLTDVLQMPSIFAARLYELLWHGSMAGRRPEIEVELMELKFSLGLVELDKKGNWTGERYRDWRDFRKQLQYAVAAFKKHGSLNVSFKGERIGRKIGRVRFQVQASKPIPHLGIQPVSFDGELRAKDQHIIDRLHKVGFTGNTLQLIKEHPAAVIEAAIAITEQKQRQGVLKRPGGFLRSILKDGTARQEALAREEQQTQLATQETSSQSNEDALMAAWEGYRRKVADEIMAAEGLAHEQVIDLVQEVLKSQPSGKLVLSTLKENEWRGPVFEVYRVKAVLERFSVRASDEALDLAAFQATFSN